MKLLQCQACRRHVRSEETSCPFCGQSVEGLEPRAVAPMPERSRAAAVLLGAAAMVGCGKEAAQPPPAPNPTPTEMAMPAYGGPPVIPSVPPTYAPSQETAPSPAPSPAPSAKDAGPPPGPASKPAYGPAVRRDPKR